LKREFVLNNGVLDMEASIRSFYEYFEAKEKIPLGFEQKIKSAPKFKSSKDEPSAKLINLSPKLACQMFRVSVRDGVASFGLDIEKQRATRPAQLHDSNGVYLNEKIKGIGNPGCLSVSEFVPLEVDHGKF